MISNRFHKTLVILAFLLAASCSPNSRESFDDSCANDLECMGWYVTDYCDDQQDITYSFFDDGDPQNTWGPYTTKGLNEYSTGTLKCQRDQRICIGAQAGENVWGVGMEGNRDCERCCGKCNGMSYMFDLRCK